MSKFVTEEKAREILGCDAGWLGYVVADQLVRTKGGLLSLEDLEALDVSEFMVTTDLAAARYGCIRQWIDALTRRPGPNQLRAYRQGIPGKHPTLLFKLKDIVAQMKQQPDMERNGGRRRKAKKEENGA